MSISGGSGGVVLNMETGATREEVRGVQAAVAELGLVAEVSPTLVVEGRGGPDEIPVIIQVVVGFSVLKFLEGFLAKAGEDTYDALRRFMRKLRSRRTATPFELHLVDRARNVTIYILDEDPDGAFKLLPRIPLDDLRDCNLIFHQFDGHWVVQPKIELDDPDEGDRQDHVTEYHIE